MKTKIKNWIKQHIVDVLSAGVERVILINMNRREEFIAEVWWFYFIEAKFAKYKELINERFYTKSQAYNIAKNL